MQYPSSSQQSGDRPEREPSEPTRAVGRSRREASGRLEQSVFEFAREESPEQLPPSSPELLRPVLDWSENSAFVDSLTKLYEGWKELTRSERAERLEQASELIKLNVADLSSRLKKHFDQYLNFDTSRYSELSTQELSDLVQRELASEEALRTSLGQISFAIGQLKEGPFKKGKAIYGAMTGFLDDRPTTMTYAALTSASAFLATAVYGAIKVHGIVGEAIHALPSGVQTGLHLCELVVTSTLVMYGAYLGSAAFGSLKTLAGRALRSQESVRDAFDEHKRVSSDLQSHLDQTISSCMESINGFSSEVRSFYERNEALRRELSSRILGLEDKTQEVGEEQAWRLRGLIEDLAKSGSQIGKSELADLYSIVVAQEELVKLAKQDIRSVELQPEEEVESDLDGLSGLQRVRRKIFNFAQSGWKSVNRLWTSSENIGSNAALDAAKKLHDDFDDIPNTPVLDVLPGLGAELSSVLGTAISTSKPEKMIIDALNSGAQMLNFDDKTGKGDVNLKQLLAYVFMPEEFKKSKFRWAGKFVPLALLLAFKKPVILAELQKKMGGGEALNPKALKAEIYDDKGRLAAFRQGCAEFGKTMRQAALGGARKLFIDTPLTAAAHVQNHYAWTRFEWVPGAKWLADRVPVLRVFKPDFPSFAVSWFKRRERNAKKQRLKYKDQIPFDELEDVNDTQLKYEIFKHSLGYREGKVSPESILAMLKYKEARNMSQLMASKWQAIGHDREIASHDSRLLAVRDYFTAMREKLDAFNAAHHEPVETPVVFEGIGDGTVIWRSQNGQTEMLGGKALSDRIREHYQNVPEGEELKPIVVLSHADQARLNIIQSVLRSELEAHQQAAILETHERAVSGKWTLERQVKELLGAELSLLQIFGTQSAKEGAFPGIYRLGLIGNSVPSEALIQEVRAQYS